MSSRTYWWLFAAMLAVSGFLLTLHLGEHAFVDYDEASYASIIQSTLQSGDVSVPLMVDKPSFEKPPLYYWLAMASGNLFSDPEFAYRFPAILFTLVSIALVMLITLEASGHRGASLFAGFILLTSGLFFEAGRQLRLDVPVTACILLAAFSFLRGRSNPRWLLGIGAAIGLGVMLKSVIGLFAIPAVLVWAVCVGDWKWLKNKYTWIGILVGLAIAAPWHMRESLLYGSAFWNQYVGLNVIERVSSNIWNDGLTTVFFMKKFFWAYFPWSYVVIVPILLSVFAARSYERLKTQPFVAPALISVGMFGFFMLSQTRLLYYFIPVAPFMAIAIALAWSSLQKGKYASFLPFAATIVVFAALFTLQSVGFDKHEALASWVQIADEERLAGIAASVQADPEIYLYRYPYAETIRFYSGNKKQTLIDTLPPPGPGIIVSEKLEFAEHQIPAGLLVHLKILHEGPELVVLKYDR